MKSRYEISELAIQDLEGIWQFTVGNWSVKQANKYYELLIEAIEQICKFPQIGKSIESIKKHHRMYQVKSHLIIYKIVDDFIWIDRILHQRMDILSRLEE